MVANCLTYSLHKGASTPTLGPYLVRSTWAAHMLLYWQYTQLGPATIFLKRTSC